MAYNEFFTNLTEMEIYNEIVFRSLDSLVFCPDNPKNHSEEDVADLAAKLQQDPLFFKSRPILLSDRTGELMIIGGEGRCRAARSIGMTEAPTFLFEGLTEEDEARIMQEDNSHTGKWDDEKLQSLAAKWGAEKMRAWAPDVKWSLPVVPPSEEELDGVHVSTIPLPGIIGDEKTTMERIIINYRPEQAGELAEMLGIDKIVKILYTVDELKGGSR